VLHHPNSCNNGIDREYEIDQCDLHEDQERMPLAVLLKRLS
jgi:hypothetical protein